MLNGYTRKLLEMGVKPIITDNTIWAHDKMGRKYDHLTDEEAVLGTAEAFGNHIFKEREEL